MFSVQECLEVVPRIEIMLATPNKYTQNYQHQRNNQSDDIFTVSIVSAKMFTANKYETLYVTSIEFWLYEFVEFEL